MAISFIGVNSAAANNATLPAGWQAGDIAVVLAYRDGSTTAPTLPAGWTNLPTNPTGSNNSQSGRVGTRVLQSGDTGTGTWTNATEVIVGVYRGVQDIGSTAVNGAQSNTLTFPALTPSLADGTSWVIGLAGHRTSTAISSASVTDFTNRSSGLALTSLGLWDTNAGVASWSQQTASAGTNSGHREWVIELVATETVPSGAPEYIASTTGTGSSANPTSNKPSGTTTGDLLIANLNLEGGTATTVSVVPSGWTLVPSGHVNQSSNIGMALYYKVATASEPSSYQWTLNATKKWAVGISIWRGATFVDAHDSSTGASGNPVAPSVTANESATAVLRFFAAKTQTSYTGVFFEKYDAPNTTDGTPSNMLSSTYRSASGSTGTVTPTASGSTSEWVAQTLVLAPTPAKSGTASISHTTSVTVEGDSRTNPPYQKPVTLLTSTGLWDTTSPSRVDDNPTAFDSLINEASISGSTDPSAIIEYELSQPGYAVDTSANAHKFRAAARKNGDVTATLTLHLLVNGSVTASSSAQALTGTSALYEFNFTAPASGTVGVRLEFTASLDFGSAIIEAVDWYAPTGSSDLSGTASTSAASAATASGTKATSNTTTTSATSATSASGTKAVSGAISISHTAITSASGGKGGPASPISHTQSTSASGSKSVAGTAQTNATTAATVSGAKGGVNSTSASAASSTSASGQGGRAGAASASAASGVTAQGSRGASGAATASSTTTLSVQGVTHRFGSISLTVVSSVSASGQPARQGTASVSAASAATTSGQSARQGTTSISATTTVATPGQTGRQGAISASSASSATALGASGRQGTISLSAASSFTASGSTGNVDRSGTFTLSVVSAVTFSGTKSVSGSASSSNASAVSASGSKSASGSVALSASTAASVSGQASRQSTISLTASTSVSASGGSARQGVASVTSAAITSVAGKTGRLGQIVASAATAVSLSGITGRQSAISLSVAADASASGQSARASAFSVASAVALSIVGGKASGGSISLQALTGITATGSNTGSRSVPIIVGALVARGGTLGSLIKRRESSTAVTVGSASTLVSRKYAGDVQ